MVALLPFGAFLAVFTVYPLWELVRLSFTETSVVDGLFVSTYNGLENCRKIFEDPVAIESMKVTAWFIVLCVVITVLFGLIGALQHFGFDGCRCADYRGDWRLRHGLGDGRKESEQL